VGILQTKEIIVDYFLTEEQQMIVDISRQITDEKIIPQLAELDEKEEVAT
jgi:butyryl-CoA dehydrogenase